MRIIKRCCIILIGFLTYFFIFPNEVVAQKLLQKNDSIISQEFNNDPAFKKIGVSSFTIDTQKFFNNDSLYNEVTNKSFDSSKTDLKKIVTAERILIGECLKKIDVTSKMNDADLKASDKVMIKDGNAGRLKQILIDYNKLLETNFTKRQMESLEIAPFDLAAKDPFNFDWEHQNFSGIPAIGAETILKSLYLHNINVDEHKILEYWISKSK